MDDDTFFPSMARLVEFLKQFDETQPHWIGRMSENEAHVAIFGVIAYGAAGVFFSRPLLDQLGNVWDQCGGATEHGDGRIAQCIYQYTTTKLTIEPDLHQLDLKTDAAGFFEAGRSQPFSVHHWKSYFDADMVKLSAISTLCGDECVLRQ
jgi:hypothetical protein